VTEPWLVNVSIVNGLRRYEINGEDVTPDICHIRYVATNADAHAHGPLEAAAGRIRTILALQRYATDLAAGGGVPWGVLKSKYKLTADQATGLRTQWVSAARDRLAAPAVLDSETDLMITQIQPKDMQLIELQQAAEARIAVLLGLPPYMLALPTNAGSMTYTNATLIYQEHYGWLRTKITQIAGALSWWSLPWGTDIEFDAERYIQPPAVDRADYYQKMFSLVDPVTGKRVMTVDEIRHAERIDLLEVPS
jgi:phage portal protein BeeE